MGGEGTPNRQEGAGLRAYDRNRSETMFKMRIKWNIFKLQDIASLQHQNICDKIN